MKILFLLGDDDKNSPERKLAEEAGKMIGKDAEVVWYDPALPFSCREMDGIWIFTHEEDGGCPSDLFSLLEEHFAEFEEIPTLATGVGGKEGGMNAVTEISEFFEAHGGRFFSDSEPLCVPMRTARFEELEGDERMELFFLVDEFLKYCGMDDSESRKIGFEKVVDDYFRILKFLCADGEKPNEVSLDDRGTLSTAAGPFAWKELDGAPAEIRELRYEIEALAEDYEIEPEEILPALREKIRKEW